MIKQKKSFLDKIVGSEEEVEQENESMEIRQEEDDIVREIEKKKIAVEADWGEDEQEETEDVEEVEETEEEDEEDGQLPIDVYQNEDSIFIKSIIGGVRPEDLDISVTNDMVTVKGSREGSEASEGDDYYYQECFWGSFSRSVILPCDIKVDAVEASMKNGILTIKMPKLAKGNSTKIEVKGE